MGTSNLEGSLEERLVQFVASYGDNKLRRWTWSKSNIICVINEGNIHRRWSRIASYTTCGMIWGLQTKKQWWVGEPRAKKRVNVVLRCPWRAEELKVFVGSRLLENFGKSWKFLKQLFENFWIFSENFRCFQKSLKMKKETDFLYMASFLNIDIFSIC